MSSWLLCFFTTSFPTETAFRVLDSVVLLGPSALILVAASFIISHEAELLATADVFEAADAIRACASGAYNPDTVMDSAEELSRRVSLAQISELRTVALSHQMEQSGAHIVQRRFSSQYFLSDCPFDINHSYFG